MNKESNMESYGDSFYTNLLNNGNIDVHGEYMSQENTISISKVTEDEETHAVEPQSQLCSSKVKKRPHQCNFTQDEDLMLVSSWLNISMDAITGTDQNHQSYWERVHAYFEENKQFSSNRTANALMHRWSIIQLAVGKFQGFFNQIEARNQSGITEQDKICQAIEMYKSMQKTPFSFIHCWNVLRYAPKFCERGLSKKRAKTRVSDPRSLHNPDFINLANNDAVNNEHVNDRPIGGKVE